MLALLAEAEAEGQTLKVEEGNYVGWESIMNEVGQIEGEDDAQTIAVEADSNMMDPDLVLAAA